MADANVNLAPVELAWLAPPVKVSAGVNISADVVSLPLTLVALQPYFCFPCGLVFAKVSAGFVGQPPVPEIVFIALP